MSLVAYFELPKELAQHLQVKMIRVGKKFPVVVWIWGVVQYWKVTNLSSSTVSGPARKKVCNLLSVGFRVSIIPSKKIPAEFFFDGIHDTEYGIPAEFRKNSVSTEYEFCIVEFRKIRNSVKIRNYLKTRNSVNITNLLKDLISCSYFSWSQTVMSMFTNIKKVFRFVQFSDMYKYDIERVGHEEFYLNI